MFSPWYLSLTPSSPHAFPALPFLLWSFPLDSWPSQSSLSSFLIWLHSHSTSSLLGLYPTLARHLQRQTLSRGRPRMGLVAWLHPSFRPCYESHSWGFFLSPWSRYECHCHLTTCCSVFSRMSPLFHFLASPPAAAVPCRPRAEGAPELLLTHSSWVMQRARLSWWQQKQWQQVDSSSLSSPHRCSLPAQNHAQGRGICPTLSLILTKPSSLQPPTTPAALGQEWLGQWQQQVGPKMQVGRALEISPPQVSCGQVGWEGMGGKGSCC